MAHEYGLLPGLIADSSLDPFFCHESTRMLTRDGPFFFIPRANLPNLGCSPTSLVREGTSSPRPLPRNQFRCDILDAGMR